MRKELAARKVDLTAIKPVRRELTDAVKEMLPDSKWAYKNFMDLAYIVTLGQTAKTIREERGADPKSNATEFLTADELSEVTKMTFRAAALVELGYSYHQVKAILQRTPVLQMAA